jgi:hypothetical protein
VVLVCHTPLHDTFLLLQGVASMSSALVRSQRTLLVDVTHSRRFLGSFLVECGLDLSSLAAFVSRRLALSPSTIVDDGV